MDKVAISRSVSRLEQRGLLIRQVAAADRRRSELCLSEAGKAIYEEIVPLARAFEQRLLDSLDAQQRAQLDELLATLQAAAEHLPRLFERLYQVDPSRRRSPDDEPPPPAEVSPSGSPWRSSSCRANDTPTGGAGWA